MYSEANANIFPIYQRSFGSSPSTNAMNIHLITNIFPAWKNACRDNCAPHNVISAFIPGKCKLCTEPNSVKICHAGNYRRTRNFP